MSRTKRDWNQGKKKPQNSYRYIKDVGLVVVFPTKFSDGYSFVILPPKSSPQAESGHFRGPFPTREYAQSEADKYATPVPADSPDEFEEETAMSEANSNAAEQQEVQYVTKARFDRLVAYVQELVTEHNRLDARVVELEKHEANRQRIESEIEARKQQKHNATNRNTALEAEAS